jgi:hypothetical protein
VKKKAIRMENTKKESNFNNDEHGHSYRRNTDSINKCESLDEGTSAFMHWMNSNNKKSLSSSDNPIILKKFVNDKYTILHDTCLSTEVEVKINSGVPVCKYCKSDDCAHVGFAICVEQLYGHRRGEEEKTIEDIIDI